MYCKICESCGDEERCCTFVKCFSHLVKREGLCEYGNDYIKHASFALKISDMATHVINNLENKLFTRKMAVKEFNKKWNEIYDEVFNKK